LIASGRIAKQIAHAISASGKRATHDSTGHPRCTATGAHLPPNISLAGAIEIFDRR